MKKKAMEKEDNIQDLWLLVDKLQMVLNEFYKYQEAIKKAATEELAEAYGDEMLHVKLNECVKKCNMCPHGFSFVTYHGTSKGRTITTSYGDTIRKPMLRSLGRLNAYRNLKETEEKFKKLFRERSKYADKITKIKYALRGIE